MKPDRADETVTVRMPKGTADQIRAATGQPFSRIVRWTMLALLERYKTNPALNPMQDVRDEVNKLENRDEGAKTI